MKKKLTQAVFFLSIFGVIWVVLNISVRKKEDYLLRFKPAQVESVQVQHDQSTLQMISTSGNGGSVWTVQDGSRSALADETAAKTFLAFLARIKVVERFKAGDFPDAESQARLGLGSLADIRVTLKSGKVLSLLLGKTTPSGTEIYAASAEDSDDVATIPNSFEKRLLPDFMGLRTRQLFSLHGIAKLELNFHDTPVSLEFVDGQWRSASLSSEQVAELIQAVRAMFYVNYFPSVADEDLGTYGLTLPDISITEVDIKGVATTYDFSRYGGRYYLRRREVGPQDVLILPDRAGASLTSVLQKLTVHRSAR